jgi:DNA polymerase III epsilon subunit-like protein
MDKLFIFALKMLPYSEEQLRFIESPIENSKLIAVAGSGKTASIAGRISHLLSSPISKDPETILIISFSNAALSAFDKYNEFIAVKGLRACKTKVRKTTFHQLIYTVPAGNDITNKLKINYVIIDEAQDLNIVQQQYITAMMSVINVSLVGDPNQNIYASFPLEKKTDSEFLINFPGTTYTLTTNYRSTREIIEHSVYYQNYKNIIPVANRTEQTGKPILYITNEIYSHVIYILSKINLANESVAILSPTRHLGKQSLLTIASSMRDVGYNIRILCNLLNDKSTTFAPIKKYTIEKGIIYISTVHSTKGLEFDNVIFINSCDTNIGNNVTDTFVRYVAYTRAINKLFIIIEEFSKNRDIKCNIDKVQCETPSKTDLLNTTTITNSENKSVVPLSAIIPAVSIIPNHFIIESYPSIKFINVTNNDIRIFAGIYLESLIKEDLFGSGSKPCLRTMINNKLKYVYSDSTKNELLNNYKSYVYSHQNMELIKSFNEIRDTKIRTLILLSLELNTHLIYEELIDKIKLIELVGDYPHELFSNELMTPGKRVGFENAKLVIEGSTKFMFEDKSTNLNVPFELMYTDDDDIGFKTTGIEAYLLHKPYGYYYNAFTGTLYKVDMLKLYGLSMYACFNNLSYAYPYSINSTSRLNIISKPIYLIFDTETNGVPYKRNGKIVKYDDASYDNSRLIQLAWCIIDDNYNVLTHKSYLIKDTSIINSEVALKVNHILDESRNLNGDTFESVFEIFDADLRKCSVIINHGSEFDLNIIAHELYIRNIPLNLLTDYLYVCTKRNAPYSKQGLSGMVKITNSDFDFLADIGPHDALYDVALTVKLLKNECSELLKQSQRTNIYSL